MSGRGLGHTGGTLDKLESIPGYRTGLSVNEFKQVLRRVGTSIIGQSASLAPADKKLYALRDVTATVASVPLIAASVMSKKLAEGASALVLDVKCGNGAFMKSIEDAEALARTMVAIGTAGGVRTEAVITDMNAPLGSTIGNALEIIECMETLKGNGPDDLTAEVVVLASRMLVLSQRFDDASAAGAVREAIASGAALAKFRAMVEAHGGDGGIVDDYGRLPRAGSRQAVTATRDGYLRQLKADLVGRASMALGAGRERVDDRIDHAAGVVISKKPGDAVRAGETVLELVYNDGGRLDEAVALVAQAIEVADAPPPRKALVLARVA